jgi:hypothetical protein
MWAFAHVLDVTDITNVIDGSIFSPSKPQPANAKSK